MSLTPQAAHAQDLDAVRALVAAAQLPTEGLADQFPAAFVVVRDAGKIVGVAGLETHGRDGLLRSVAVDPAHRHHGLGRALIADRLRAAAHLDGVYLLTTTAAAFFRALGFTDAARDQAPAALRASSEFASVCPSTAVCLRASSRSASPS